MTIAVIWYDRYPDMKPNYNKRHYGTITGDGADDVWRKFTAYKQNHDLAKFTIPEITGMWD